jgi:hypothetical protein
MNGGAGRPLKGMLLREAHAGAGGGLARPCQTLGARLMVVVRSVWVRGWGTLGRPSDGSDVEVTRSSTWSPQAADDFRAVVCPAGALAEVVGSHWLNRHTDETGGE